MTIFAGSRDFAAPQNLAAGAIQRDSQQLVISDAVT
jgi:hypothetical protein